MATTIYTFLSLPVEIREAVIAGETSSNKAPTISLDLKKLMDDGKACVRIEENGSWALRLV